MTNSKSPFKLILFDIDGTLLRTAGAGRDALRAAMLEIFGTSGNINAHPFNGKTDWYISSELLAEKGYSTKDVKHHMPAFEQAAGKHLAKIIGGYDVQPCPGAMDIVGRLREQNNITPGIITGNFSATAPVKLRAAGFDPAWFPVGAYGNEALTRDDLPPLALQRAIDYTGKQIAPEQVIVIGDTPADVACARALGALAVAVETGFTDREKLLAAKPDYLLPDLTTFSSIVL